MRKVTEEINVYVISNEQPFENWFGTLKFYDLINNKCIVENNKEEDIELYMKDVQESDTNQPIKDFLFGKLHKDNTINFLIESNLSIDEAKLFYELAKKITPKRENIDAFYDELENVTPFEGGMGITEAIVGLTESL